MWWASTMHSPVRKSARVGAVGRTFRFRSKSSSETRNYAIGRTPNGVSGNGSDRNRISLCCRPPKAVSRCGTFDANGSASYHQSPKPRRRLVLPKGRRFLDGAYRVRPPRAVCRESGCAQRRAWAHLAAFFATAGRRVASAADGGAKHVGNGFGGVIAPRCSWARPPCERSGLAHAAKRARDFILI